MAAKNRKRDIQRTKPKSAPETPAAAVDDRSPGLRRADEIRSSASRETIEAFVVAFILALLFRAFIAEAFVIPTGSMAPTLMGAHKDLTCDRCETQFAVGASLERRGPMTDEAVVGGVCPNCRHTNLLDLAGESNHQTFAGDRILVSKFAYTLGDPDRWDVIVFKFPGNPKQNYIKRLVGLPNEILTVLHGDVYSQPTAESNEPSGPEVMLRKPAEKLLAMKHLVYDTDRLADALISADYPARWQPWRSGAMSPPSDSWVVERTADGLTATIETRDDQPQWLRYFHRWPTEDQWAAADAGQSLADVDPYQSRLITDFYAYDAAISVNAREVYRTLPAQGRSRLFRNSYRGGEFLRDYQSGGSLDQFRNKKFGSYGMMTDGGLHWVGDLVFEADVETSAESAELTIELVEAGIKYQCVFDLSTGIAELKIDDNGKALAFDAAEDGSAGVPTATTSVTAGSRQRIRFSNCDDQVLLWVDDALVEFDRPTTFTGRDFRTVADNHPRFDGPGHPLDAAPVGIAVRKGSATIHHLRIDRDQYYIATSNSAPVLDYDESRLTYLAGRGVGAREIRQLMMDPEAWNDFPGWDARRSVSFPLENQQYFPMGDNSPESLDARCWAGAKGGFPRSYDKDAYRWSQASYVPRDLLVGKALMIFWPHPWNSPVPFTPNFRRMQLIR